MAAPLLVRPGEVVRISFGGRPKLNAATKAAQGDALSRWLRSQSINAGRATLLIRPFRSDEFGDGSAAPSNAHLDAANRLMRRLRKLVVAAARLQGKTARAADAARGRSDLDAAIDAKEGSTLAVAAAEKVWQFYWDIFEQRQTRVAPQLLAADRIALDCYQYTYGGLGKARSIPSPAPLAYLESGTGPATFRRDVVLSRLGRLPNPFPLVKLPYHRLVCPWTLGAVPHEVGHNLQADLGLWHVVPRRLGEALKRDGLDPASARTWTRWHKEIFAGLIGVLLIGPAFVSSLMDVVGKSGRVVMGFNPAAVHPVPYLRVLLNLELLRRSGFAVEAAAQARAWSTLYPPAGVARLPAGIRRHAERAIRTVVEVMAFAPYDELGGKALAEVVGFRPQDQSVAREAAQRLALGRDPGIVPERFMIVAARLALDHRLAPPGTIARHFYEALGRR
jgi:hypothetical protein